MKSNSSILTIAGCDDDWPVVMKETILLPMCRSIIDPITIAIDNKLVKSCQGFIIEANGFVIPKVRER
jgi:hypothetical protein